MATLVLGIVISAAPAAESGPPPLPLGRTILVVQPDPRLCPTPLCGGYWVSRANHARTRCHDRLLRPRCYVAAAIDWSLREPLTTTLPAGSLVRGAVVAWPFDGFQELGAVIVNDLWKPATPARTPGRYYRLRDTGVRCVRAPCFSVRAWRLNRAYSTAVSGIDLGAAPVENRDRIEAALGSKSGTLAQGGIVASSDGGRVFRATRFFLSSEG